MPPQEDDQDTWCLIESDPAVFWDIANKLGVQGLDFQELYTLDSDELKYTNSREIRVSTSIPTHTDIRVCSLQRHDYQTGL